MNLPGNIKRFSSLKEPFAGGEDDFDTQIKASLPFLKLIPRNLKNILVVGSGEGYEVKWLVDHGFETHGVTKDSREIKSGKKKFGLNLIEADMHELPFNNGSFDCVYAANILEHSVAPMVALAEWRRVLKKSGWLVVVMPSKEWLPEYYHYSVLTHSQMKDVFYKSGFRLLAGPQTKPGIDYNGGDIFYDLGRRWGHYDGYVAKKCELPKSHFLLGEAIEKDEKQNSLLKFAKTIVKIPYNTIRIWYARNHHE